MPIPLDGIRTCTAGIRAHRASDYTTRVRPHRVSRSKHFRHSPGMCVHNMPCAQYKKRILQNFPSSPSKNPIISLKWHPQLFSCLFLCQTPNKRSTSVLVNNLSATLHIYRLVVRTETCGIPCIHDCQLTRVLSYSLCS